MNVPACDNRCQDREIEALLAILVVTLCIVPFALQRRRLDRLARSWELMAQIHDWLYVPVRGPWFNRENCRLMVPSRYGAIEVAWHPGYRGTSATTSIRSLAEGIADFSIHLADKGNPERVYQVLETGDPDYDALYSVSSTRPNELLSALDGPFRADHVATIAEFECCDQMLTLEAVGIIAEERALLALLSLNLALLKRLKGF